mmetsp:Transcript_28709/g.37658  ORF Transcript_28709/g.37658 Transcript_28709/m.37658 type:complete len:243 (-) Transcript_28709:8-736(-)
MCNSVPNRVFILQAGQGGLIDPLEPRDAQGAGVPFDTSAVVGAGALVSHAFLLAKAQMPSFRVHHPMHRFAIHNKTHSNASANSYVCARARSSRIAVHVFCESWGIDICVKQHWSFSIPKVSHYICVLPSGLWGCGDFPEIFASNFRVQRSKSCNPQSVVVLSFQPMFNLAHHFFWILSCYKLAHFDISCVCRIIFYQCNPPRSAPTFNCTIYNHFVFLFEFLSFVIKRRSKEQLFQRRNTE